MLPRLTHAVDFADDDDIVPWDDVPTLSGRLSSLSWQWTPMPAEPVATASVAVQSSPGHASASGRRSVSDGSADARSVTRSPTQALAYAPSPSRPHAKQSSEKLAPPKDADPHAHPTQSSPPASALAVYRLAHRYQLFDLANRALSHIVTTLSPRTALSLLLATPLWADLHGAIKVRMACTWVSNAHRATLSSTGLMLCARKASSDRSRKSQSVDGPALERCSLTCVTCYAG